MKLKGKFILGHKFLKSTYNILKNISFMNLLKIFIFKC